MQQDSAKLRTVRFVMMLPTIHIGKEWNRQLASCFPLPRGRFQAASSRLRIRGCPAMALAHAGAVNGKSTANLCAVATSLIRFAPAPTAKTN